MCDISDQVLISRNPGGRVAPALQHAMLFDIILGLKSVIVIHHTGTYRALTLRSEVCADLMLSA